MFYHTLCIMYYLHLVEYKKLLENLIGFNAGNVFWASFAFFCIFIFVGDNILQKFFPELNDLKQFFKLSICF